MSPVLAVVALTIGAGDASADLAKGLDGLAHGDYKLAKRALTETKGADSLKAKLALAKLEQQVGNYKIAEKHARALLGSRDLEISLRAHAELAQILRTTGRYTKAKALLEPIYKANPTHLLTRHALGLAYVDLGMMSEADALWNIFFDEYAESKLDLNNAEVLYFVAEAAKHLGSVENASNNYQEAIAIKSDFHRANLDWGHLFLGKYTPSEAEQSFSDILKVNAKHPGALAGMAALKVKHGYDAAASQELLEQALAANPNRVDALLVRAGLEIDRGEWAKAKATANAALKVNPESFGARAILATISWLHDDFKAYEAQKKRVLAINPKYSQFFHIMMRTADREHRYEGGIKLGEEAIRINPKDYEAMQLVGSGYLRLSREKEGLAWLRKAYKGDQYNHRTLNVLDLFETVVPRDYVMTKSKTFGFRYHKDERRVLERYITPTMEAAYADMVKRYGFTPKQPLTLEIYKESEHYAVRTIGLPGLGALGVCFGHVVTAMSPSVGNVNWGMVMWHELSHVFAIQLSDYRVPRWFTEGLSEYETIRARPEWRRENDSDLWAALQDGTLPSVAELNLAFMKPSMQAVVVAYHLSSVTIEYIVAEYGFPVVVTALKLFAKGKETPEVIEKITGRSVAQFDKEFRAHLRRRLAPYKGSLFLPSEGMDDVKALQEAAKKSPKSADAQARLALGFFYAGKAKEAATASAAALALDANHHIAIYIRAELAIVAKDVEKAKGLFTKLVQSGGDSYDVRLRLSMLAMQAKDKEAFVGHLQTAKTLDPERSHPYEALAEFYKQEGKTDEAMRELENYAMIEQMSVGPLLELMGHYAKAQQWNRVIHFGELALNLDPAQGKVQLWLGQAYQETKAYDDALYAYETALLIRPRLRRPALAHLGLAKALLGKGDTRRAKSSARDALDLEPENAEAIELSETLK
ncbi:MAG: tetratricopeptide repeat protein [Myxococcales bacterium]|nr:tetratricopeptide repeat protein [Myxococcales bacterium]